MKKTEPTFKEMYRELLDMFQPNLLIELSDEELINLWKQQKMYDYYGKVYDF